VVLLMVVIFYI